MKKIGTHDSLTGETSIWWSWLLIPFAKTQSKTLIEQFNAGCRLFDIRAKHVYGKWRGAHGLWFTKRSLVDILNDLTIEATKNKQVIHITITYEGKWNKTDKFLNFIENDLKFLYESDYVKMGPVSAKYGKNSTGIKVCYDTLKKGEPNWIDSPIKQFFLPLDGRSWHTYLPIPWLWKKLYFNKVEFDENTYKWVDFL